MGGGGDLHKKRRQQQQHGNDDDVDEKKHTEKSTPNYQRHQWASDLNLIGIFAIRISDFERRFTAITHTLAAFYLIVCRDTRFGLNSNIKTWNKTK